MYEWMKRDDIPARAPSGSAAALSYLRGNPRWPVVTGTLGGRHLGAIAQLEERLVCIQKARGSSPLSSTGQRPVAILRPLEESQTKSQRPRTMRPCISRDPAGTPCDLGVIARMTVAQLDPAHGARLFKCDRSCWKSGLRAARFTNAYQRRPSAPPRKMTADPVQCGGQATPDWMLVLSRHILIMHLPSLGYEHP